MSKCISNRGEYSEHTFTHNPECDYCGEPLPKRSETMRTALEQIQELHPAHLEDWGILGRMKACRTCHAAYPCKTRKLADEGLGGV